jgi:hypothetical protein
MSPQLQPPAILGALCIYDECRYCAHRVNASKTAGGQGQCALEARRQSTAKLCKGRVFFKLSPDRADAYRGWVLGGSVRGQAPAAVRGS